MTAHRAKSKKTGKINAIIAKTIHLKGLHNMQGNTKAVKAIDILLNLIDLGNPKWDAGKFKAISATHSSIPITGLPLMRPTFWLGPSMVRLLVGPRTEQTCSK